MCHFNNTTIPINKDTIKIVFILAQTGKTNIKEIAIYGDYDDWVIRFKDET